MRWVLYLNLLSMLPLFGCAGQVMSSDEFSYRDPSVRWGYRLETHLGFAYGLEPIQQTVGAIQVENGKVVVMQQGVGETPLLPPKPFMSFDLRTGRASPTTQPSHHEDTELMPVFGDKCRPPYDSLETMGREGLPFIFGQLDPDYKSLYIIPPKGTRAPPLKLVTLRYWPFEADWHCVVAPDGSLVIGSGPYILCIDPSRLKWPAAPAK